MNDNQLQVFMYDDKHIRTITEEGTTWFVGKDVAETLGHKLARKALRDHVDTEDKRAFRIGTPSNGGYSPMT